MNNNQEPIDQTDQSISSAKQSLRTVPKSMFNEIVIETISFDKNPLSRKELEAIARKRIDCLRKHYVVVADVAFDGGFV